MPAVFALLLATGCGVVGLFTAADATSSTLSNLGPELAGPATTGAVLGGAMFAGMTLVFVVGVYLAAVPALIAGLILTRNRDVWRCVQCGYAYDRT